jgi:hypothetical protein
MRRAAAVAFAAILGASIAPAAARAALDVTRGLTTQPFANQNQTGTRAFGYLTVLREGLYRFELRPASTATVQVDGSAAPEIQLARGAHFVLVEIAHQGERPPFELTWAAREQTELVPVPAWQLSPERVPLWKLLVVRGLEWIRAAVLLAAAVILARAGWVRYQATLAAVVRQHPRRAAFVCFALLAIVHTWPLASSPSTLSRYDNSDAMLNEWALAWVAHQIVRDPLHLFDANIFFPERNALAYSEAMLVQGLLGAPLAWLGAPPLLVYNLVLLAGFTLTGWATCLVAARWTGSWAGGAAAGIVAAFNAHTLTRLPHLQALHVEFLPLALGALDAVLREPKARHALKLALWFGLQALTSIYLLTFSAFALVAAAASRPREWIGRRFIPVAACLALAAGVSLLALWPYLQPYWQVHREQGAARLLRDVELYSASWKDYLSTPSRLHYSAWSSRWFTGTALFPGLAAMIVAAVAVVRGTAWRDPRARMCLAFGICGLLLSFGTKLPGYELLFQTVPLLQAVRAVSRFGYLGTMAVGFLAAFGLAELRARLTPRRWPAAAATLLALLALEPLVAPLRFTPFAGVSSIYETIASDEHAVVVELPMPSGFGWFGNARYMINSTRHFRPMLNGYSGFAPASFHEHVAAVARFPHPDAIDALRTAGVTHVFVHLDGFTQEQQSLMETSASLRRMRAEGRIVLYRVTAQAARRAE